MRNLIKSGEYLPIIAPGPKVYRDIFGGDSSAPAAPDYSRIAAANEKAAEYGYKAANEDLAFRKQVYQDSLPRQQQLYDLASQIAAQQLGASERQDQMAQDQNAYYKATFMPLEQQMALQAQGGMDMSDVELSALAGQLGIDPAQARTTMGLSKAAMERQADKAVTQANAASNSAYSQGLRQLTRMGGDPNKLAHAAAQLAGNQTLASVGAANQARTKAKADIMGLTAGAASFGRNMPNTAGQMYGLSTNSGNSAVSNQNTGFMSGLPYAQFAAGGYGTQLGAAGLGSQAALGMGGLMANNYNAQVQAANSGGGGLGALLGFAGQIGSAYISSDRRLKIDIEFIGKDDKTGLNLYEFSYIGEPDRRFQGVMADEVELVMPEAVVYDSAGFAAVNYGMLGIQMVEV